MMHKGMTIIELMLGLFLSSLIASTLFLVFSQLNRVAVVGETIMDIDTRIGIIGNQWEKDLMGAFIPLQYSMTQTSTAQILQEAPSHDVFHFVRNKNTQEMVISWISNNPLRVYEKSGMSSKPLSVRIVYRLTPDKNDSRNLMLTRQEGSDLSLKAYALNANPSIKPYVLAQGIKECSLSCKVFKLEEKKDKQGAYETLHEWREQDIRKRKYPLLPNLVTLTCVLWTNEYESEKTVSFDVVIPAASSLVATSTEQSPLVNNNTA
jgi:type II secretory pathway component PulJ